MTDSNLSSEYQRDAAWGPMSHPATETIEAGAAPWKDHIYLAFWDPQNEVYGFFHWNTSPNHPTHKAQVVAVIKGEMMNIIDPLPARAELFKTEHLYYDLKGDIRITHPRLKGQLTVTPRFTPVDYTPGETIPPLVPGKPLNHYQQGLALEGQIELDGVAHTVKALGFRTRTWGFRDDSMQFIEYFSLFACYEDMDISVMKFRWPDGRQLADGGVVANGVSVQATDIRIRRDRAGLPIRLQVDLADGRTLELTREHGAANFWCPIGLPERDGPTFCAHDEVVRWKRADSGSEGYGLTEQGIIRFVA